MKIETLNIEALDQVCGGGARPWNKGVVGIVWDKNQKVYLGMRHGIEVMRNRLKDHPWIQAGPV